MPEELGSSHFLPCFFGAKPLLLNPELACSLELAVRMGQSPSCFHLPQLCGCRVCRALLVTRALASDLYSTLAWAARAYPPSNSSRPAFLLLLFLYKFYAKLVHLMPSYSFFSCPPPPDWFPCLLKQPYFYLQDTFCVSI